MALDVIRDLVVNKEVSGNKLKVVVDQVLENKNKIKDALDKNQNLKNEIADGMKGAKEKIYAYSKIDEVDVTKATGEKPKESDIVWENGNIKSITPNGKAWFLQADAIFNGIITNKKYEDGKKDVIKGTGIKLDGRGKSNGKSQTQELDIKAKLGTSNTEDGGDPNAENITKEEKTIVKSIDGKTVQPESVAQGQKVTINGKEEEITNKYTTTAIQPQETYVTTTSGTYKETPGVNGTSTTYTKVEGGVVENTTTNITSTETVDGVKVAGKWREEKIGGKEKKIFESTIKSNSKPNESQYTQIKEGTKTTETRPDGQDLTFGGKAIKIIERTVDSDKKTVINKDKDGIEWKEENGKAVGKKANGNETNTYIFENGKSELKSTLSPAGYRVFGNKFDANIKEIPEKITTATGEAIEGKSYNILYAGVKETDIGTIDPKKRNEKADNRISYCNEKGEVILLRTSLIDKEYIDEYEDKKTGETINEYRGRKNNEKDNSLQKFTRLKQDLTTNSDYGTLTEIYFNIKDNKPLDTKNQTVDTKVYLNTSPSKIVSETNKTGENKKVLSIKNLDALQLLNITTGSKKINNINQLGKDNREVTLNEKNEIIFKETATSTEKISDINTYAELLDLGYIDNKSFESALTNININDEGNIDKYLALINVSEKSTNESIKIIAKNSFDLFLNTITLEWNKGGNFSKAGHLIEGLPEGYLAKGLSSAGETDINKTQKSERLIRGIANSINKNNNISNKRDQLLKTFGITDQGKLDAMNTNDYKFINKFLTDKVFGDKIMAKSSDFTRYNILTNIFPTSSSPLPTQ